MKRRYCEEHDDLANTDAFAEGRVCHYWGWQVSLEHEYGKNDDDPLQPCRMVPMRLIPDNAETVERIAKVIGDYDWWREPNANAILAALDGETP